MPHESCFYVKSMYIAIKLKNYSLYGLSNWTNSSGPDKNTWKERESRNRHTIRKQDQKTIKRVSEATI